MRMMCASSGKTVQESRSVISLRPEDYLEAKGESPVMLMNGGIFEPGGVPSGVMAQEGKELLPVNLKDGKGNFFLKPNGIFLISDNGARVVEASKYPPEGERILSRRAVPLPLLLEGGKIHPAFNEGSASRLLRNGVGVAGDGTVVFAISDSGGSGGRIFSASLSFPQPGMR